MYINLPTTGEFTALMRFVLACLMLEETFCKVNHLPVLCFEVTFKPQLPIKAKEILSGRHGLHYIVSDDDITNTSTVRIHHLWEYIISKNDPWDENPNPTQYGIRDGAKVAMEIATIHQNADDQTIARSINILLHLSFEKGCTETIYPARIPENVQKSLTEDGFDVRQWNPNNCTISLFSHKDPQWIFRRLKIEMKRCLKQKLTPENFCAKGTGSLRQSEIRFLEKLHFQVSVHDKGYTIQLPKNYQEILEELKYPMTLNPMDGAHMAKVLANSKDSNYKGAVPLYNEVIEHLGECLTGNLLPEQFCVVTRKHLSTADIITLRARHWDVVYGSNYTEIRLPFKVTSENMPVHPIDGICMAALLQKNFSIRPKAILRMLETTSQMLHRYMPIRTDGRTAYKTSLNIIPVHNFIVSDTKMTADMKAKFPDAHIVPVNPLASYLNKHGWNIQMSIGPFSLSDSLTTPILGYTVFAHYESNKK